MLFNLAFVSNNILSFFLIFFNYWLVVFNSAVIPQIFDFRAELAIPEWIPTKEAKAEIWTNSETAVIKISNCPI